jgi:predicted PurR-regulated permease PerM
LASDTLGDNSCGCIPSDAPIHPEIYLIAKGKIAAGIIIAVVSLIGTQSIDYFLRPLLVGSQGHLPFLTIFLGILGGLEFFGLIGLILGPLVLIMFIAILSLSLQVWSDYSDLSRK